MRALRLAYFFEVRVDVYRLIRHAIWVYNAVED
jgi:hypothetical protein